MTPMPLKKSVNTPRGLVEYRTLGNLVLLLRLPKD